MVPQLRAVLIDGLAASPSAGVIDCAGYEALTVYVTGSAALSAGVLIIEESPTKGSTGTWSQIASVTLATPFASAGGEYATHLPLSAYAYVGARIGTSAVGGTITVELRGQ